MNRWGILAFAVCVPTLSIALAELFWFLFTGHVSALVGGFVLVGSILIVLRKVGEWCIDPYGPWSDE